MTKPDGRCAFQSRRVWLNRGPLDLTLHRVVHPILTYDAAANKVANPLTGIQPQSSSVTADPSASVQDRTVRTRWRISDPSKVQGLALYRSLGKDPSKAERLVAHSILAAEVIETGEIAFTDPAVSPDGEYTYWLVQITDGEDTDLLGSVEVVVGTEASMTESVFLPVLIR